MLFYIILFLSLAYLAFYLIGSAKSEILEERWSALPYKDRIYKGEGANYPKLCKFINKYKGMMDVTAVALAFVFFFGSIFIGVGYCSNLSFIKRYNAVYVMFESRGSFTDLERAAIFNKAADYNAERVELRYWNKAFFGIADPAIPDEIEDLKPIQ
jgi:hypothetical protein